MSARVRSIFVLVALSLAFGAAAFGQAENAKPKDEAKPDDKQKLLAEADQIAERVSKLRGLKILRPIRRGVMSKPQITERLMARVNDEYKPEEIVNEELMMKRLGLLPPDADYLKLVIDLLTSQIAGFYDPWEQQLYIADWMTIGNEAVMAHEIDHALQDQHFRLRTWMMADKKNADATLARQSLIEGDGLALMVEFSTPTPVAWGQDGFLDNIVGVMMLGLGALGDVPLVLKETLIFPYLGGVRFVGEARKTRPWSAIDQMFKKPPLSTEHILHPSTYASYERPVEIRPAAPAALKGMKLRYDNVLGELGLSVFLRQHKIAVPIPAIATAGWGGDRVGVFTVPGSNDRTGASAVAVLYTVWDSEVDAIEFFSAMGDALPSLSGGSEASRKPELIEYRGGAGAITSAERRRDAVVVVINAPAASAADVRAQVWKGWTAKRR